MPRKVDHSSDTAAPPSVLRGFSDGHFGQFHRNYPAWTVGDDQHPRHVHRIGFGVVAHTSSNGVTHTHRHAGEQTKQTLVVLGVAGCVFCGADVVVEPGSYPAHQDGSCFKL